jgi:hypothetical protein
MAGEQRALLALSILVVATLILVVAAIVVLVRARRIPGLGATSGSAIEEVAAAVLASRHGASIALPGTAQPPVTV